MAMTLRQNAYMTKKGESSCPSYVCSTFSMRSRKAGSNHYINQKKLKQAVLQAIQKQLETVSDLEQLLDQVPRRKIAKTEQNPTG